MKIPKLVMLLAFEDSRKVGFGLWLFIFAIALLFMGKIQPDHFSQCVMLSWAMIGGGTIADRYLGKKNDPPTQ